MRIYNDGANAVITKKGRLDSKKFLDVSDEEGTRLIGMYETIKDARKMAGLDDEKKKVKAPEPVVPGKGDSKKSKGK